MVKSEKGAKTLDFEGWNLVKSNIGTQYVKIKVLYKMTKP